MIGEARRPPKARRRALGFGARAKLLSLRGGGGGGTGRENGVWSRASSERPRCSELGVLGRELRAGAGPRHAPASAVSPLRFPFIPGNLALFLRDKDQPLNPLQIPAGGAGPALGSRQWAWSRAQRTQPGSSRPTFCKLIFLGTESTVPGISLASSLPCFCARHRRVGGLWFHCSSVCVGSVNYAQVFQVEPNPLPLS